MAYNLLLSKKNIFSQNGEDGVIDYIFKKMEITEGVCCEFGAWDGIHLSNARNLILHGWTAIMIEGEKGRLEQLKEAYKGNNKVIGISEFVDDEKNNLRNLFTRYEAGQYVDKLDFLSIDIDGLDYYIFKSLDFKPKVICIEVNAGHDPNSRALVERSVAKNIVGQSWQGFTDVAEKLGYKLVCYTGNAFYIRNDLCSKFNFEPLTPTKAYQQFIESLSVQEREWLFLVNFGIVEPFYRFNNPYLSRENLRITGFRADALKVKFGLVSMGKRLKKFAWV